MKTCIAVVLALVMISLGLTACGGDTVDPVTEPDTEKTGPEEPKSEEPKAEPPASNEEKSEHPSSEHPK